MVTDKYGSWDTNQGGAQNILLLPDTALSIGSNWSQKIDIAGEVPVNATINYTLQEVQNGVGTIQSLSDFTTTTDKPINVMGTIAKTNLKGSINGTYKALEKSGFLISANTQINIKGTIELANNDIPLNIKISKILVAK